MPNWRKLIVSGSDASLNSLNVTQNVTAQSFTGSFSGSVSAPGSTTQVVYNNNGVLAADSGLVYTGGNVGIGTNSPGSKLDVRGRTNIWGAGTTSGTLGLSVLDSPGSNYNFYVEDNGGAYLRGNVRIGNSTDNGYKLDVDGIVNIASSVVALRIGGVAAVGRGLSTDGTRINGGTTDGIEFTANNNSTITTVFRPNGLVGIGTTNPSQKLEVNGALVVGMTTPAPFWNAKFKDFNDGSGIYISAVNGGGGKYIAGNSYYYNSTLWWSDKTVASAINLDNGTLVFYTDSGLTPNTGYTPTERMRITSAGNIGIGITTPSELLEVVGNIRANISNGGGFMLTGASASGLVRAGATGLALRTNTTDRLTIDNSGNVGIGTASPGTALDVIGDIRASNYVYGSVATITPLVLNVSAGDLVVENATVGYNLLLKTNGAERMRVTNLGSVGIGTFSPAATLEVNGNVKAISFTGSFSGSITNAVSASYAVTASYALNAADSVWTGSGANIYYNLGNVGIGTTSPGAKLEINGNSYTTGLRLSDTTSHSTNLFQNGTVFNLNSQFVGDSISIQPADYLSISTYSGGLVERLRVTNGGNVGIGTTSPLYLLDLGTAGSGNQLRARRIYASGTGTDSGFTFDNTLIYQEASGTFNITNPGSYPNVAFTINNSGNVGIGTTAPTSTLQVSKGGVTFQITDTNKTANSTFSIYGYSQTSFAIATGNSGSFSGGEKIIITDGGNIGIGTTGPSQKLHLYGSGNQLLFIENTGTYHLYAGLSSNVGIVGSNNATPLSLQTNGVSRVYLDTTGNVGIGTTSPTYKLNVVTDAVAGRQTLANIDRTAGNLITFTNPQYSVNSSMGLLLRVFPQSDARQGAGIIASGGSNNGETDLDLFVSTGVSSSTSYSALKIKSDGNVGIGTTSPSYKLDVNGIGNFSNGFSDPSSETGYRLKFYDNGGIYNDAGIGLDGSGGGGEIMWFNALGGFYWGLGTGGTKMKLDSSGNLGIGTTTPSEKLHVIGNTILQATSTGNGTTAIRVNNSAGTQVLAIGAAGEIIMNNSSKISTIVDPTSTQPQLELYNGGTGYTTLQSSTSYGLLLNPSGGNVGIGTASPSQKLSVAGAISVSGSVVDYKVSPAAIAGITTSNIVSFTPGVTKAAFIDYVIIDSAGGTNQRVGTIMVSISLNTVSAVINETTTVDIGNTSAVTFGVSYGPPVQITATNTGPTPYDISYMVRYF